MQNTNNIQDILSNSLKDFANNSMSAYKPMMDGMVNNITAMSKSLSNGNYGALKLPMLNNDSCDCCPPKCECPPQCMASISRCAAQGERILVPFMIKNTCTHTKTFRIGVRELKDQDGKLAPSQPHLNKHAVTLDAGRAERVLMLVDLEKFEQNGATYNAEIVIREKRINQNICFTLKIDNDYNVITAAPQDEQKFDMHWQSWQSHYYCEPKKGAHDMHVIKN